MTAACQPSDVASAGVGELKGRGIGGLYEFVLSFTIMVVTLMKLRWAFEGLDTFQLGLSTRSFYPPPYCYANYPRKTLGFGGGDVAVIFRELILHAGRGRPCRHCFVFLKVGWGNFNPVGAHWRRGMGGMTYHRGTRQI